MINVPAGEVVTVHAVMVDGTREKIAELTTEGQHFVTAQSGKLEISDNAGLVTQTFSGAPGAAGAAGGAGGLATGEKVLPLEGDALVVQHATWFVNDAQGSIAVQPAEWRNEVMTCYLKTSLPVSLSGVNWLFGAPVMVERYTYVIALQQLGESVVFANLAYTIPQ